MVKLFCAIVGEESVVTIDIGDTRAVGDLKKAIKREAGYDFPSHKLILYLAKLNGNKNGAWMKDDDGDLVQLQEATIPEDIEKKHLKKELLLKPTWSVGNYFFNDKNFPKEKVIHVLVDTRGKDHLSVAVANGNSPLLPGGKKSRGEKCTVPVPNTRKACLSLHMNVTNACFSYLTRSAFAGWLPVFPLGYYWISVVFFGVVVFWYGKSPGDKKNV